jgi:hypothetical protein
MLKNILTLKGVQKLSESDQKTVAGGNGNFELCFCASLGYEVDCVIYDRICPLEN